MRAFRTEALMFDDVQIVVHAASLRSELENEELTARLKGKLPFGGEYLFAYAGAVTQTERADGIGFALPTVAASDEAHIAAFEQFIELPSHLIAEWAEAIQRVNVPPRTVAELQPGVETKDPKSVDAAPTS